MWSLRLGSLEKWPMLGTLRTCQQVRIEGGMEPGRDVGSTYVESQLSPGVL